MEEILKLGVDLTKPEFVLSTTWYTVLVVGVAVLAIAQWMSKAKQKPNMPLKSVTVKLKLPGTEIEGTWEPDEAERRAAWELYVELVTRTTVVELKDNEGLLREVLTSYHSLFDTTRRILRQYGPTVAVPKPGGKVSFGQLAVPVLNLVLRPVLAKWHPLLLDWETKREDTVSPVQHEEAWPQHNELRQVLRDVQVTLVEYASILEEVAEVPSLIKRKP